MMILKWAHTASSYAQLNFGGRSKLDGTHKNCPKIDQNVKFPIGKQDFLEISITGSPLSWLTLELVLGVQRHPLRI